MGKKKSEQNARKTSPAIVSPPPRSPSQRPKRWLPIAVALALTFVVFLPCLSNDFVNWDDDINVYENQNLKSLDWAHGKRIFSSNIIGGYNPLTILSFAIEKHFFGLNPRVFHFNNLLLHLICVFLVYRVMVLLNVSQWGAALAAALFGIHPMHVESVAWITERKDVLYGAFYLGALVAYVRYLQTNYAKKFLFLTLALFTVSLFAKIQAVALPLSLLALDYYFKRPLRFRLVVEKIPFFVLSLLVGGLGVYLLSKAETLKEVAGYNFFGRLLIGTYSFCVYIIKFLAPYKLSALYPYPSKLSWEFYVAPLFAIGLAYWLFRAHQRKNHVLVFGCAFFLFNIVFVLQILGAGQGFLADRFSYIPYVGLIFLVAKLCDSFAAKPENLTYARVGFSGYLALFAVMSWNQCGVWKNGDTLWTHVIKGDPKTALPYGNRAFYYRTRKEYQKALADYGKALELSKDKSPLHNSRGKLYFDLGQVAPAITEYSAAIQQNPKFAEAYVNRGAAHGKLGQYDRALEDFNKGIELDPDALNGYFNRSLLFSQLNKLDLAIADYDAYLKRDAANASIWYERGLVKRNLGRNAEAVTDLNEAIRLDASQGLFYLERSRANQNLGKPAEALSDARHAQARGVQVEASYLRSLQSPRH